MAATRTQLHDLVDQLPEDMLEAFARILGELVRARSAADPVLRAFLDAPEDDEPLTPEDEAAIAEGLVAVEHGEVEPLVPRSLREQHERR